MVLPLIIVGALVVVGGVVFWQGSNNFSPAIKRIFNSKEKRDLDLMKEQHNFEVSKRGVLDNAYAFFFGESAYAEVLQNRARPQKPLTGEPKETVSNFTKSRFTNGRATRFNRNG